MSSVVTLVERELEQTIGDLIRNYNDLGLKASGKYAEDLESFVTETEGGNIKAGIMGAAHSIYMETGRDPNKKQSKGMQYFLYQIIIEWMQDKGITDINPWMTAGKIMREGIKVPNQYNPGGVISDVINDKWLDEFQAKVLTAQNALFIDEVVDLFKEPV
jgi:hypothetical protein